MDTGGEKDLCLFWEWAKEYLDRYRQSGPFSTLGGLIHNRIGWYTIFGAVCQKGQLMPYYGVSRWSVVMDESGVMGL